MGADTTPSLPANWSHGRRALVQEKYRRSTGRRFAPNSAKALEIVKEKARAPNRRITGSKTGPETGRTGQLTGCSLLAGVNPSYAALKSKARPKRQLRTRECHSALIAMRRSRRKRKWNSIYPRYSRGRRSWPIDASPGPAQGPLNRRLGSGRLMSAMRGREPGAHRTRQRSGRLATSPRFSCHLGPGPRI
jgi:hypothetical protein